MRELEDYIDAQNGGPGKGLFRIVTDPVPGPPRRSTRASWPWSWASRSPSRSTAGCTTTRRSATATDIDRGLDEVYKLGVRHMELINKFDNALARRGGRQRHAPARSSTTATSSRPASTGRCRPATGPPDEVDRQQTRASYDHDHDDLLGNALEPLLPLGAAPVYPRGAHCNARGLTDLGEHLIRRPDGQADDHRPRPPQRARAQVACCRCSRPQRYSRRRVQPQLEHART